MPLIEKSLDEVLDMFPCQDGEIMDLIQDLPEGHLVVFRPKEDKSQFGTMTLLLIGPDQIIKDLEGAKLLRIGDEPASRQYPTIFCKLGNTMGGNG